MTHPIDSFRAERIMIKTVKNGQFYTAGPGIDPISHIRKPKGLSR